MQIGFRERVRYWFDATMSRGTPALIGWLGLASAVLVCVVSGLAMLLAPADVRGHPLHVLWMSLLRTLDPGTMGADEGSYVFLTLMLIVTIGGIFIVSALVGVLSTGLDTRLAALRKGRSWVVERGHTIVLGWSDEVFTIVTELAKAGEGARTCVVVLAERDKVEMEDEIRSHIRRIPRLRVVCRTGDPREPLDLEIARPDQASAIVIPAPAVDDPDIDVVKILLALNHRTWPPEKPPVIAVISDSSNMPAAALAGGEGVELIDAEDITARLVVQSRRQAGLSVVCTELLSFDGQEMYLHRAPTLAGMRYDDAQLAYDNATLIGLRHADGTVSINPTPDTLVEPTDETVVLALSASAIRLAADRQTVTANALAQPVARPVTVEQTLILGWNRRGPTVVELLDRYAPAGSTLRVGAVGFDAAALPPPGRLVNLTADGVTCDPTQRAALEDLEPQRYDHIVVLSDDNVDRSHADSRTMITLLHLRDMKVKSGGDFAIVSELNDDANRRLAQVTRADDFIVGRRMISLLLSQLSRSPHLNDVIAELFEARGADIYLRPANDYIIPDTPATFATVIAGAAARGETAIGVRRLAEVALPPSYGIELNPAKRGPVTLTARDKVIVLATRDNPQRLPDPPARAGGPGG